MKKSVFKKVLGLGLMLAIVLQGFCGIVFADVTLTGEGTSDNPYQIGTYEELAYFRDFADLDPYTGADKYVVLTADIVIPDGVNWYQLGVQNAPYSGTFDGKGHKISGLNITTSSWHIAFFGWTNGATIKNLTLEGNVTSTKEYIGGFIGTANNTTIENCKFIGNVSGVGGTIAGFIGRTDNAAFTTTNNTIRNSAFIGNVTNGATSGSASGFAFSKTDVSNSYFVGDITGHTEVSGVGWQSTATNCFAYGTLTANTTNGYVCRIAGTATNCYYKNAVSKSLAGQGTQASEYEFKNGKIAYQLGDAFGQIIGTDDYPVFATADNKVIKESDDSYVNEGGEDVDVTIEIGSYEDLAAFRDLVDFEPYTGVDKNVVLTADIVIPEGVNWYPIGTPNAYSGTFDGAGHKITGLNRKETGWHAGFFKLTNGATIKNLTIEGNVESTAAYAGGFVGEANNTNIENCKFIGNVTGVGGSVAGFIGRTDDAAFTTTNNTISNSAFIGEVTNSAGSGNASGFAFSKTDVSNSYLVGDVTGHTEVSGVGWQSTATNCFAYGTLTANTTNGYVCKIAVNATNSYFMNTVSKNLAGQGTQATKADFASGKIAYQLGNAFGQTMGVDLYPVFATEGNSVSQTAIGTYTNDVTENGTTVPYTLKSYSDLVAFRTAVNSNQNTNAKLIMDIDMSQDANWYAIASAATPYSGTFDGNGYKITNFKQSATGWNAGLFKATNGATIKNLTVEGNVESTVAYVGGLIGKANNTTIDNCKFIGNVSGVGGIVAGFIGQTDDASFTTANNTIANCAFIGNVTNSATSGSASGFAYSKTDARNTYFIGDVSGNTEVAGIGFQSTAANCFAYGTLKATKDGGHVCKIAGTATNSYYLNSESTNLAGQGTQANLTDFASGKIAYLLNNGAGEIIFGQTIGTDLYPVFFDNNMVYQNGAEYGNEGAFATVGADGVYVIASQDTYVMVAQYAKEGNVEILLSVTPVKLTANEEYGTAVISEDGADLYRVFVWNSSADMKPVCSCAEYEVQ